MWMCERRALCAGARLLGTFSVGRQAPGPVLAWANASSAAANRPSCMEGLHVGIGACVVPLLDHSGQRPLSVLTDVTPLSNIMLQHRSGCNSRCGANRPFTNAAHRQVRVAAKAGRVDREDSEHGLLQHRRLRSRTNGSHLIVRQPMVACRPSAARSSALIAGGSFACVAPVWTASAHARSGRWRGALLSLGPVVALVWHARAVNTIDRASVILHCMQIHLAA
jgi:hypothetical protein